MAACDCYVSLHRAEGFGLTLAEAMAIGKPVIAHRLLGQRRLHERREQLSGRLRRSAAWARNARSTRRRASGREPSVEHAAELMRRVYGRSARRRRAKGERAAGDVARLLSPAATGQAHARASGASQRSEQLEVADFMRPRRDDRDLPVRLGRVPGADARAVRRRRAARKKRRQARPPCRRCSILPVGLALLVVVCGLLLRRCARWRLWPARRAWSWRWRGSCSDVVRLRRADRPRARGIDLWAVGAAVGAWAIVAAPIVLSGKPGFTGYAHIVDISYEFDLAAHFAHSGRASPRPATPPTRRISKSTSRRGYPAADAVDARLAVQPHARSTSPGCINRSSRSSRR